jgi:hypothetical protein
MPNTEEDNRPITIPSESYHPMSLGPIGRGWLPRLKYAGTYDQHWLDNQFPFLPTDFDNAYYQSAPPDQQIAYPTGGEEVTMVNLTRAGHTAFKLPEIEVPVTFFRKKSENHSTSAVIDTIVLEPDKGLFTMLWRTNIPLKRNIFEIPRILVGSKPRGWWRAREKGKKYYPSLAHLSEAKHLQAEEEE